MDYAFEFIKTNGGITSEADYPYLAKQTKCNVIKVTAFDQPTYELITLNLHLVMLILQKGCHVVVIDGYEDVPVNDEEALMKAVANQPVSVAVEASGPDFQFYSEV